MLYDRYWSGSYQPSFQEVQANRAWLQGYGKPIWIVEFGAGNYYADFQQELLRQALSEYSADGYKAIVYLNISDSNIAGPDYRLHSLAPFGNLFTPPPSPQPIKTPALHKPAAQAQPQVNKPVLQLLSKQ